MIYANKNSILISGPLKTIKNGILPIIAVSLISFGGSAWSYEKYSPNNNYDVSRETSASKYTPASYVNDMCKSLLKTRLHISSESFTNRRQRTAGKIAALGVILGVRFAIEPINTKLTLQNESPKRQGTIIDSSSRSATSIMAYRKCQKEYALNIVN